MSISDKKIKLGNMLRECFRVSAELSHDLKGETLLAIAQAVACIDKEVTADLDRSRQRIAEDAIKEIPKSPLITPCQHLTTRV